MTHTTIPATQPGPQTACTLSIVIVSWNCLEFLLRCLDTISTTVPPINHEVIVVDNASEEDPSSLLRAQFPRVRCMRLAHNVGFGAANNLGVRTARGRYLLFLNPDTELLGSAVASLLHALQSAPHAGAVGPRLLNTDGTTQTSCIQRFPTILNQLLDCESLRIRWPRLALWGMGPLYLQGGTPCPVEVISGACMMMTRDAFAQCAGFDESYFLYAEDVDLCYRLHRQRFTVLFVPPARVVHHGGGPSRTRNGSAWIAVMQRRALLHFCRQAHGPLYALAYRMSTALIACLRVALLTGGTAALWFSARRPHLCTAIRKWHSVLNWAVGLNSPTPEKQ